MLHLQIRRIYQTRPWSSSPYEQIHAQKSEMRAPRLSPPLPFQKSEPKSRDIQAAHELIQRPNLRSWSRHTQRWVRSLTKLSGGAHQRFACWGNTETTSHDLPLQHPNFAFVNCERKTKYEEIIGDCVGFGHEGY